MRCPHCGSTEYFWQDIKGSDGSYREIIHKQDCILVRQHYVWPWKVKHALFKQK